MQAAGKQVLEVIAQVSDPESFCKSPVVTPYFVDSAAQPEPEAISCPAQVVAAAGALVVEVVVAPKLIEVTGGA